MSQQTPFVLLPCPFCSSTNLGENEWHTDNGEEPAIECNDCMGSGLKANWNNRRATPLNKDTLRLDWLADTNQNLGGVTLPNHIVLQNVHSMRDAIDAAMVFIPKDENGLSWT